MTSQKVKVDLALASQRKAEVLTLFASEKTLDNANAGYQPCMS